MDWELIWWLCLGGASILVMIGLALPWNDRYKRKNNPYENCPKEKEY